METARILIVEDEVPIAELLQYGFQKEGFAVCCAQTAGAAILRAADFKPEILLLDWMLPDMSGLELCRLFSAEYRIPIVMLTARSDIEDKLSGLESGADDYITKPFDMREVVGRVRAVLRRFEKARKRETGEETGEEAPLCLSASERVVMNKGKLVELPPKEYDLLSFFMQNPRKVFSRQELLSQVWGYEDGGDTRTVDLHVQRLRKKLNLEGRLVTVFGVGYKYVP